MMKSAKNSTAAAMPEVMPIMYQASQAGIKVLRYFSDPIRMKREAEPINEMPSVNKTLLTILIIISLLRRFLTAVSASFMYSLRMALISFRIEPINSLNENFSDI